MHSFLGWDIMGAMPSPRHAHVRLGLARLSRQGRLRRGPVLATGLVSVAVLLTVGAAVTAITASADTPTTQSFTSAGTYYVTVPDFVSSMDLAGLGGAGFPGDSSSGGLSPGGSAGSGTSVSETIGGGYVAPGDTLEVVVGAKGGGGQRGYGSELSGAGGNGGGATYIYDQNTDTYLLVAGGGGGGGGGSGLFGAYYGGNGGTDSAGGTGLGAFGQSVGGSGGDEIIGGDCGNGAVISPGTPGGTAPTASGQAGGGGGGGGACGGDGGQAGDGNGLVGGGGGGGSGGSITASFGASNTSISNGSNTADGSASLTFTTYPLHKPVITSANCVYSGSGSSFVTAVGLPGPTLQLVGQPSWLGLGQQVITWTDDNQDQTTATLGTTGQVVDGEYTFAVEASNSQGTDTEPLTVVEEPGITKPSFVSAATATATAGSAFSYQVTAVSCPPIGAYDLSPDAPSWLHINQDGVLSGTPAEADTGSHTFTITATPQGNATPFTQTFTLQVNAAVPGAPTIGTATAGNAKATVSFTPPADNGGAPITGYTVTATDTTTPANGGQTATGSGSPITVTGLTNGDTYTFTVTATNSSGPSQPSAPSNAVTPATVPGGPVIGTATASNGDTIGQATVSFTRPASDGGAAITSYTVTATDVTTPANGGQTATGSGSPITVTGLTNGDSYTFTVTATNSVGTGQPSAASNAVTPVPPGKPAADLSVTINPRQVTTTKSTFTETITVTNLGPWPATGVITTVPVPSLATVSSAPGGTQSRGKVTWTSARIGVRGSVTYPITFKVGSWTWLVQEIDIRASATSQVPDPHTANNTATAVVKPR